eukprot:534646-Prorocentrum_minimum.AAC.4
MPKGTVSNTERCSHRPYSHAAGAYKVVHRFAHHFGKRLQLTFSPSSVADVTTSLSGDDLVLLNCAQMGPLARAQCFRTWTSQMHGQFP